TISGESTILDRIGFLAQDHVGTVITSDYVVDLSGTKFIYVISNLLTNNLVTRERVGCLVKIPAIADTNAVILYSDSSSMPNVIDDLALSQRYFILLDDDGTILDLEGRKMVDHADCLSSPLVCRYFASGYKGRLHDVSIRVLV